MKIAKFNSEILLPFVLLWLAVYKSLMKNRNSKLRKKVNIQYVVWNQKMAL